MKEVQCSWNCNNTALQVYIRITYRSAVFRTGVGNLRNDFQCHAE
jgi:hypothetical protein